MNYKQDYNSKIDKAIKINLKTVFLVTTILLIIPKLQVKAYITPSTPLANTVPITQSALNTLTISIPKHLTNTSNSNTIEYTISIDSQDTSIQVSVIPDNTLTLTQPRKPEVIAHIHQDKTTLTPDKSNNTAKGIVEYPTLSAGTWKGSFNFNINIIEAAGLYGKDGELLSKLSIDDFESIDYNIGRNLAHTKGYNSSDVIKLLYLKVQQR